MAKDNKNYKNILKINIFLNSKKYFCTDLNSSPKVIKNDTKHANGYSKNPQFYGYV